MHGYTMHNIQTQCGRPFKFSRLAKNNVYKRNVKRDMEMSK